MIRNPERSIRETLSMPRPTTGAYFVRMQKQHTLANERKHEVVRKEEMTEEEKTARRDMVRAEEALKIANREFRTQEKKLKEEKTERERELATILGTAKAVRVEVPMQEETAAGGIREMYIVRQNKKIVKENTLGRLELFALEFAHQDSQKELHQTYGAVFDQIQQEHLQARTKAQTKTSASTSTKRTRRT